MAERKMGIIGASGFIGGKLAESAAREGWTVCGFSRSGTGKIPVIREWRSWGESPDLGGLDAIVNLAGHPVDQRWTEKNRRLFHESRVGVTRTLVEALQKTGERPAVLVNGSAVGIYGDRGDEILTEDSAPGSGYLAELCREWESAADGAEELGVRVVLLRTGIVLGSGGAAFEKMRRVFQFGLGGRLGNGKQWMPWIHIQDLVNGILHAIGRESLSGPVNGTAPEPVKNEDFTRMLAEALHRPAIWTVPGFALKMLLDGFGATLLEGQRALPEALEREGFLFAFPDLGSALADLVKDA